MLISRMSRHDATGIFLAGVKSVQPSGFIPAHIRIYNKSIFIGSTEIELSSFNNLYVAAAGKAASAMAQETEKILSTRIKSGLVITKYEHTIPLHTFTTIEAGHPVPDENSIKGGNALLNFFKQTREDDLIIMLVSGGASALVADCPPGIILKDIKETVQLLLQCGASIDEINTVRKHLSLLKGGQLVKYTNARIFSLILSDVPGDDLSIIASGLTVADKSTFEDAWNIVDKYRLSNLLPDNVRTWLQHGINNSIPDTPKPGDKIFDNVTNIIVANNAIAIKASAVKAKQLGYSVQLASPILSGEASTRAVEFIKKLNTLNDKKLCLLMGGETTVTIKGKGKGGRNQEFVLAALCESKTNQNVSFRNITILSGGTDGTDGPTDAAGALADEKLADQLKSDPCTYLADNDAYHFFKEENGLLITGPTQTNVMDIVIGLINHEGLA